MYRVCTSILVGVVSLVLEIPLLSKTTKLPFLTMDYSPWSSKNLIERNRPKKFMQVGIDVTCMYTDFSGRGLSGFGDTATLKNGQFSLSDHYSPCFLLIFATKNIFYYFLNEQHYIIICP